MRAPFGAVLVLALLSVPAIAAARHQNNRLEPEDCVRLKLVAVRSPLIVGTITGLSDSNSRSVRTEPDGPRRALPGRMEADRAAKALPGPSWLVSSAATGNARTSSSAHSSA